MTQHETARPSREIRTARRETAPRLRTAAVGALVRLAAVLLRMQSALIRLAGRVQRGGPPAPCPRDAARAAGDGMDTDCPEPPAHPVHADPHAPDLEWVTTVALFRELSRRHDGSMYIGWTIIPGHDATRCQAVVLSRNVMDTEAYLRETLRMVRRGACDIREEDL